MSQLIDCHCQEANWYWFIAGIIIAFGAAAFFALLEYLFRLPMPSRFPSKDSVRALDKATFTDLEKLYHFNFTGFSLKWAVAWKPYYSHKCRAVMTQIPNLFSDFPFITDLANKNAWQEQTNVIPRVNIAALDKFLETRSLTFRRARNSISPLPEFPKMDISFSLSPKAMDGIVFLDSEINQNRKDERWDVLQMWQIGSNIMICSPLTEEGKIHEDIKRLFEDERVCKVVWDFQLEKMLCKKFGIAPCNIIDLQEEFSNNWLFPSKWGLGSACEYFFSQTKIMNKLPTQKEKKMMRHNWEWPPEVSMVQYAAKDVYAIGLLYCLLNKCSTR
jgi:hypothetical protein